MLIILKPLFSKTLIIAAGYCRRSRRCNRSEILQAVTDLFQRAASFSVSGFTASGLLLRVDGGKAIF
jgi:hypothetical protein